MCSVCGLFVISCSGLMLDAGYDMLRFWVAFVGVV